MNVHKGRAQPLQLRFGEGLRFTEIAVFLNKREATVRKMCTRTIAHFTDNLRTAVERKSVMADFDEMLPEQVGGTGSLISLHMIDLTTGWALSEHAILRTTDGGLQWENVTPPHTVLTQECIAEFLTASLAWIAQHGWATDGIALYNTSDGGQHWAKLSPGANFKQITYLSFVSSTTGWAIGRQNNTSSSLFKTTDGGKTWTPIPISISDH